MPLSNKESEWPPSSVTAQVDLIMTGQVPDGEQVPGRHFEEALEMGSYSQRWMCLSRERS